MSFLQSIKEFFVGSHDAGNHRGSTEPVNIPVTSEEEAASGRLAGVTAPEDEMFHIYKGPSVSTVGELADALNTAPNEVFRHHIRHNSNDFANWVRNVFNDDAAAAVIESARNPSEVVYILDTLSA
jgi:hypothetical protein